MFEDLSSRTSEEQEGYSTYMHQMISSRGSWQSNLTGDSEDTPPGMIDGVEALRAG